MLIRTVISLVNDEPSRKTTGMQSPCYFLYIGTLEYLRFYFSWIFVVKVTIR